MNHSLRRSVVAPLAGLALAATLGACGAGVTNSGVPGASTRATMPVTGTVFTIVFENKDEGQIMTPSLPYFAQLARENGSAAAYVVDVHPSEPNYITMISGAAQGIADDADPAAHTIATADNLAEQLDTARVPWRAYIESMGAPCNTVSSGLYAAKHNPWVYFTSLTNDAARCADRVVDFDQHFAEDLAAGTHRYMWITPNMCNDMHDCPPATSEAWLRRVIPQIMASPGYQHDGVIFILWDEGGGPFGIPSGAANVPGIVISPRLASTGFRSNVAYDHTSYLATVQDILGLPRLPTTADAVPMSDFFSPAAVTTGTTTSTTTAPTEPTATGTP